MKKYLLTLKLGFEEVMAMRTQMVLWAVISILPPIFSIFIFLNTGIKIDVNFINVYFVLVGIIQTFTLIFVDAFVADFIYSGQLVYFLVKPYSFNLAMFLRVATAPAVKLLISFPVILFFLMLLFRNGFFADINFFYIPIVFLACLGGLFLNFTFSLLIGLSAFFFDRSDFLGDLNVALVSMFSGSFIPLVMMGSKLYQVVKFLPFRYMLSFQLELLYDQSQIHLYDYVLFLVYILLFWSFASVLFKKGLKRYESYG